MANPCNTLCVPFELWPPYMKILKKGPVIWRIQLISCFVNFSQRSVVFVCNSKGPFLYPAEFFIYIPINYKSSHSLSRNFVQTDTLINLYRSITEPHFSYCCSVWGSCGASKLDVLQKLQNKAARIVTDSPFDASAAPLLQRLGWPPVQKLINKETGSMVYKSLNSLAPQYLSDLSKQWCRPKILGRGALRENIFGHTLKTAAIFDHTLSVVARA